MLLNWIHKFPVFKWKSNSTSRKKMHSKATSKQWITRKTSISHMQHLSIKFKRRSFFEITNKTIEHFSKKFTRLQLKSNGRLIKLQPIIRISRKALFWINLLGTLIRIQIVSGLCLTREIKADYSSIILQEKYDNIKI